MNTTVTRFLYDFDKSAEFLDMNQKLFCTFTTPETLHLTLEHIVASYSIVYNKIFVLKTREQNEMVITYNIDPTNINTFPEDTILVHRKKESNTLYTINALNMLVMELNNGVLDKRFMVNWPDYRNTILLTKGNELKKLQTSLFRVVEA
jgi:hypothetical protein